MQSARITYDTSSCRPNFKQTITRQHDEQLNSQQPPLNSATLHNISASITFISVLSLQNLQLTRQRFDSKDLRTNATCTWPLELWLPRPKVICNLNEYDFRTDHHPVSTISRPNCSGFIPLSASIILLNFGRWLYEKC